MGKKYVVFMMVVLSWRHVTSVCDLPSQFRTRKIIGGKTDHLMTPDSLNKCSDLLNNGDQKGCKIRYNYVIATALLSNGNSDLVIN